MGEPGAGSNSLWTLKLSVLASRFRLRKHTKPLPAGPASEPIQVEAASPNHAQDVVVPHRAENARLSLKRLLELRGPPATQADAAAFIEIVHSNREESLHRKYIAKKAIHRCSLQLELLGHAQEQRDVSHETATLLAELKFHQDETVNAGKDEAQAEEDVGIVRAHLQRLGFSVEITSSGGMPLPDVPPYCDDLSDESEAGSCSGSDGAKGNRVSTNASNASL